MSAESIPSTQTIDITPSDEGQAAILATFASSVLSDVRKARRDSDVALLQGIVSLAFTLGVTAGRREPDLQTVREQRERLEGLVR